MKSSLGETRFFLLTGPPFALLFPRNRKIQRNLMLEMLAKFLIGAWRVIRAILRALWEGICWLIIPVVFGYLCYSSITKTFEISVLQICLAAIALSPWMLRLLARYLSEFNIGPKGVSGKTREAVKNRDEIDAAAPITLANEKQAAMVESEFAKLLPQTKKVLGTLWKYQVEHFGPDDIRRWGFAVGTGAPDYPEFSLGVAQLLEKRLVSVDGRGFVFLTETGVDFCKQNNREIANYPFNYRISTNGRRSYTLLAEGGAFEMS